MKMERFFRPLIGMIILLCFIATPTVAHAGFFFGISDVKAIILVFVGLILGAIAFYSCFLWWMRKFTRAVKLQEMGPKAAFNKYWGRKSKTYTFLCSAAAMMVYGIILLVAL